MNVWIKPNDYYGDNRQFWRVLNYDEALVYLAQHLYKGKFFNVKRISLPRTQDNSYYQDLLERMLDWDILPNYVPQIEYHI